MTEQYLEHPEPLEWQQDLLIKSRQLLFQTYPPTFDTATTIESTNQKLFLRNGPKTEHNLYFIVEDCSDGVLMRTVRTTCNEFKERIVQDHCAIVTGGIDRARASYRLRIDPKENNITIKPPEHDTRTVLRDIYDNGSYMTFESGQSWMKCIDSISEMRQQSQESNRKNRAPKRIGALMSRLVGLQ